MSEFKHFRYEWLKVLLQAEGLTPTAKLAATALIVEFANAETGQINPSQETLADYLKVHRDTVKRVLRELRNAGYLLSKIARGRGKASQFQLILPGKIVRFKAKENRDELPPETKENRGNMLEKPGQIAPGHIMKEHCKEHKAVAFDLYRNHRFSGNVTDGPILISEKNESLLFEWGRWLKSEGFPALNSIPIKVRDKKSGKYFFTLPFRRSPSNETQQSEARNFFETILDSEMVRHAAQ